jgi:formylmethanofuran dehydrogenase subunit D
VYSRHLSADFVIAERVVDAFKWLGPVEIDTVLVISDDREVTAQARRHGTRVQGTAWLAAHMAAAVAAPAARGTSIGQGRPPRTRSR